MSDLAERQAAFMRAIIDEDAPLPEGWGNSQAAGMGVYRGNYRSALVGALEATFERTRRYVGEEPFKRTAIRHLITNPPASWTIDDAGAGFDATCAERFGDNPEVAELAWLEWAMLEASRAPDTAPMTAQDFANATASFDDGDWMTLRLTFQPGIATRQLSHNLTRLWNALEADGAERPDIEPNPTGCIVWREGERPTFMAVDPAEARAFAAMLSGANYGEIIALLAGPNPREDALQDAAMRAGQMLGGWLQEGLITVDT